MLRSPLSAVNLSCPLSVSSPPITCSTKIRPQQLIRSSNRSSVYCLTGSQKDSKDALSRIIRREAAIEGIGRKAKSKKQRKRLWPKAVLEALDEAIKDNAWYSALEVYMIESGDSLPDIFTFNSIIGAYGNSGQIEKMEKWYEEFQLMGIRPDINTFNILIKSFGKTGMYEKMGSVMKFMSKRFFSPTIVTYNIVIEVLGKAGKIEKMEEYFKEMKHKGMKPNAITYCSLVSAYSKAGLIKKVGSILRQVENSDVILDTPFFNCIISAYGQVDDIKRMAELFMLMKEKKCMPDNITFATMIQAYNTQGMIEAAQDLQNKLINNTSKCLGMFEHWLKCSVLSV
ncbi:hypothetical protein GOBAR_DD28049 [Gossypium barbadense]|nr:hypothetical protein GOBAR_DD28049 [Gossypium barbadense]